MIEIECEEPIEGTCECCGNKTVRLTRFVYQNDSAFAVYYAQFSHGHDEKYVSGIIGLGEWGDDEVGPEARIAFPFRIWMDDENYKVGLVDADESPWRDVKFLGKILDRAEALEHEWLKDVFHITDHMAADDREIVEYFNEKGV